MKTNNKREIDKITKSVYGLWNRDITLMKKSKVKLWQAAFIVVFILGSFTGIFLLVKTNKQTNSKAASNIKISRADRTSFLAPISDSKSEDISKKFTESTVYNLDKNVPIYSLSITANVSLREDDSLVRVTLVDNNQKESLVYEGYPLTEDVGEFTINKTCDETCALEGIIPTKLKIQLNKAAIEVTDIQYVDSQDKLNKDVKDKGIKVFSKDLKKLQDNSKIDLINDKIKKRKIQWVAGETSISEMTYEEKKIRIMGVKSDKISDDFPNFQGFEYYKEGVFQVGTDKENNVAVNNSNSSIGSSMSGVSNKIEGESINSETSNYLIEGALAATTDPPSVPSNLTSTVELPQDKARLFWNKSFDFSGKGIDKYNIFIDGINVGSVPPILNNEGVEDYTNFYDYFETTTNFNHYFAISATDKAGNTSMQSAPYYFSTFSNSVIIKFDWRNRHGENWLTPVKDQMGCGSCWAFGSLAATEGTANLYYNQHLNIDLSEQDILCKNSGSCAGGGPGWPLDSLKSDGLVTEDCMGYKANDTLCSGKCLIWQTYLWKITDYQLVQPRTTLGVQMAIRNFGPISFVMNSWHHAVSAVGYGNDNASNQNFWIIKNSWGVNWGENGYAKILMPDSNMGDLFYVVHPYLNSNPNKYSISCVDKDSDGYCNWGISPTKPANCPSSCANQTQEDCNDSNANLALVANDGSCGAVSSAYICMVTNFSGISPVSYNTRSTLSWITGGDVSGGCKIDGGNFNTLFDKKSGILTDNLTANTSYTITCKTSSQATCSASTTVNVIPPPCAVASFYGSPSPVNYNTSSKLYWGTSGDVSGGCKISGGIFDAVFNKTSGVSTGNLTSNTGYTLTCKTASGTTCIKSTTVNANPNPACTISMSANPSYLLSGKSATLSWTTTNVSGGCKLDGGRFVGLLNAVSGVSTWALYSNKTYTLTCKNSSGTPCGASVMVTIVR